MTNLSQNKLDKLVSGFKNIWVFLMTGTQFYPRHMIIITYRVTLSGFPSQVRAGSNQSKRILYLYPYFEPVSIQFEVDTVCTRIVPVHIS